MNLNTLVTKYIDKSLQAGRSYLDAREWVYLANTVLRDMESRGLCSLDQEKEIGVEVEDYHWITLPSDFRSIVGVFYPYVDAFSIGFSTVNGKIKTDKIFLKKTDPDTFVLSGWSASGVSITSDDIEDDEYNRYLLVVTDGDLSGKTIVISDTSESSGGVAALSFLHSQSFSSSTSTAGYLVSKNHYLMLRYIAKYTVLTQYTDLLPIGDDRLNALVSGLMKEATPLSDSLYKIRLQIYENDLKLIALNEFTPTEDQARPQPRPMPGLRIQGYRHHVHVRSDT
jgi:hypothetical protein